MSRVTPLQKEMALEEYSKLKALPQRNLDWCIKVSAKHIYADHYGNGWCTRCETKVMLPKTKHKEKIKCPNCRHEMEITHNWRFTDEMNTEQRIDWYVFVEVVNENVLALRYVVVDREVDNEPETWEAARLILDFKKQKEYTLERARDSKRWTYSTWLYFREHGLGYDWRKWCCMAADPYPRTLGRINKIKGLEYFKFEEKYFKHLYVSSVINWVYNRAGLYEKLQKAGFDKLIMSDLNSYTGQTIKFNPQEKSLIKMLGLNKHTLGLLKNCQTHDALKYLKNHPDITENRFDDAAMLRFSTRLEEGAKEYGFSFGKALNYLRKQRAEGEHLMNLSVDYTDYVRILTELGYPLDNQYLYPKDFRKADRKVNKEREKRKEEIRIKQENEKSGIIAKISQAIRDNKTLRKWMDGSDGLKVIVPESVEELRQEGVRLHNCLGTYINKVAEGNTLIFFIRKLEDPNKEYIAMEYAAGRIIQIRLDNNVAVSEPKILEFANHFVAQLNKINIFSEIRKVA